MNKITPNLWFSDRAEEAANFYVSVFRNSKILSKMYYGESGAKVSGKKVGEVLAINFELEGQSFTIINSNPAMKYTSAISFLIECKDQKEIDYYWEKLTAEGKEVQCGWLEDKFGISWQVAPPVLDELLNDKNRDKAERVFKAMLPMKKLIIADLEKAAQGK